jgi:hypothetical protein
MARRSQWHGRMKSLAAVLLLLTACAVTDPAALSPIETADDAEPTVAVGGTLHVVSTSGDPIAISGPFSIVDDHTDALEIRATSAGTGVATAGDAALAIDAAPVADVTLSASVPYDLQTPSLAFLVADHHATVRANLLAADGRPLVDASLSALDDDGPLTAWSWDLFDVDTTAPGEHELAILTPTGGWTFSYANVAAVDTIVDTRTADTVCFHALAAGREVISRWHIAVSPARVLDRPGDNCVRITSPAHIEATLGDLTNTVDL